MAPRRPPLADGLSRAVRLCLADGADAILVLIDSDDDCPAFWGPDATAATRTTAAGTAIMAVRDYESWLLHRFSAAEQEAVGIGDVETVRDAKGGSQETDARLSADDTPVAGDARD